MLPWENNLQTYWEHNKHSLEENYPGIQLRRLTQLVQDLFPFHYQSQVLDLNHLFSKLDDAIPLQYITGSSYFYKSEFLVDENVLIPRSETEILVEHAELFLKNNPDKKNVIEVGTGSGAIILSLLMEMNRPLNAVATDISLKALEVARKNYLKHTYQIAQNSSLEFYFADRLNGFQSKFDLILSNPPYIKRKSDWTKVHSQTRKFEPHLALFLDDENYDEWFKLFFRQIYFCLKVDGMAIIEGHEDHLIHLQDLAVNSHFAKVEIIKDYNEQDRFLKIFK